MTFDDFPAPASGRPVWLITLADLALLLVGFFVLLQANQKLDTKQVVQAVAEGLGVPPPPIPVAAQSIAFAAGSAAPPEDIAPIARWAQENLADPRVALRITGMTDATAADVDRATGSAALLAADRARAIAAALAAAGVPIERTTIVNADAAAPHRRQTVITLAFVGEEGKKP